MSASATPPRDVLPNRLPRMSRCMFLGAVPNHRSSDVRYCVDEDGGRWVAKVESANGLLAEALGTLLAVDLEVPTARGGIFRDPTDGEVWWLSEWLRPALQWSEARFDCLADPSELGAILALDAIIGNCDRHAANILFLPCPKGPHAVRVFSIDLANSWIGTPHDIVTGGLACPPIDKVARGIPVDLVRSGAEATAKRAVSLSDDSVFNSVREACLLAQESHEERIRTALMQRMLNAESIVADYLEALKKR